MTAAFAQELLGGKKKMKEESGSRVIKTHQQHGLFVEQLLLQDLQVPLLLLQLPADVLLSQTSRTSGKPIKKKKNNTRTPPLLPARGRPSSSPPRPAGAPPPPCGAAPSPRCAASPPAPAGAARAPAASSSRARAVVAAAFAEVIGQGVKSRQTGCNLTRKY